MAAAENNRRIHAQVVVGLVRSASADADLNAATRPRSTSICDRIRSGTEELTDADAEAIRFLTAVRTEFLGAGEPA